MTGSSFCIKFALCLGCLAGGSLAFGQSAANLSAGGLGPPTASLSANLSAGTGMVSGGSGGGGRARLSMNSSGTSDTGVRSGSRSLSSARAMQKESSLVSYGPTQTHLGYLHTGMTPSNIHVSLGSGRSTLGGLNHGGGAASGGWGGSSGSNHSTPLYSTMMKVERYGMTRKSTMRPTKPGTKKGSGSGLDKLLGQSSGH